MAQIMYYWGVTGRDGDKFRHGCQALDSYTMERYGYKVPALDAIDSFDWNAMDEGTAAPQSDAAKHAVAQLMRYCGQAAHTNFAAGESNIYDVISGMEKFGYDSDMRLIDTNKYLSTPEGGITYDEWDKISNFVIKDDAPVMDEPGTRACYTVNFLTGCKRLHKLHISPSMRLLDGTNKANSYDGACYGVGEESEPCIIIAPSGFDFGTDTSSTFIWKGGWFHLPYLLGDINHDEQVNVTDASLLVDYILNSAWLEGPHLFDSNLPRYYLGYDMEEADINHNREVNITDVTNLVNIILRNMN